MNNNQPYFNYFFNLLLFFLNKMLYYYNKIPYTSKVKIDLKYDNMRNLNQFCNNLFFIFIIIVYYY